MSLLSAEYTPLVEKVQRQRFELSCLKVTIAIIFFITLACTITPIALISIASHLPQDLQPSGALIVTPSYPKLGPTAYPCVWPVSRKNPDQYSYPCPYNEQQQYYCPFNYTCSYINMNYPVCLSGLVTCVDTPSCYYLITGLTEWGPQSRSLIFTYNSEYFVTSIVLNVVATLISLLTTVSILVLFRGGPPRLTDSSSATGSGGVGSTLQRMPMFYVVVLSFAVVVALVVGSTVLSLVVPSPNFFQSSTFLSKGCFGSDDVVNHLKTYVNLFLGVSACYSLGMVMLILLALALVSLATEQAYEGFWNSETFVEMFVWVTLVVGGVSLVLLCV